jgi:hypothetical protein
MLHCQFRQNGDHREVNRLLRVLWGAALALGAASAGEPTFVLNGTSWQVLTVTDAKVSLGIYDDAETESLLSGRSGHEAFQAAAVEHSSLPVPIKSEVELLRFLRQHPGKYDSIGFFGHGNEDGIYINEQKVSDWAIRKLIRSLTPHGSLYLFCCDTVAADSARHFTRYLAKGQSLLVHSGELAIRWVAPPLHFTGQMLTTQSGDSELWMFRHTN